jgi:replicative superfamily II helicase
MQIGSNLLPDGEVKKDAFKIVYVAPMKALVAEMVGNFGARLKPYGISVRARCRLLHWCHPFVGWASMSDSDDGR